MKKYMFIKTAICLSLIFAVQQNCFAQTSDELKAERDVLLTEMKSKEATERIEKFNKLVMPNPSGVASIDQVGTTLATVIVTTKNINDLVPIMYTRTIGESIDGVTDVTVKKPTLKELADLSLNIGAQVLSIKDATTSLKGVENDIKGISPMQVPKALKMLNFSKNVVALTLPEMELNLKIVNNLVKTLKTSNNL